MLRGYNEEINFENSSYADEVVKKSKFQPKKTKEKEILLADDDLERLNRYLLEISMEWIKKNRTKSEWKITKENNQIVIKPVATKKG